MSDQQRSRSPLRQLPAANSQSLTRRRSSSLDALNLNVQRPPLTDHARGNTRPSHEVALIGPGNSYGQTHASDNSQVHLGNVNNYHYHAPPRVSPAMHGSTFPPPASDLSGMLGYMASGFVGGLLATAVSSVTSYFSPPVPVAPVKTQRQAAKKATSSHRTAGQRTPRQKSNQKAVYIDKSSIAHLGSSSSVSHRSEIYLTPPGNNGENSTVASDGIQTGQIDSDMCTQHMGPFSDPTLFCLVKAVCCKDIQKILQILGSNDKRAEWVSRGLQDLAILLPLYCRAQKYHISVSCLISLVLLPQKRNVYRFQFADWLSSKRPSSFHNSLENMIFDPRLVLDDRERMHQALEDYLYTTSTFDENSPACDFCLDNNNINAIPLPRNTESSKSED